MDIEIIVHLWQKNIFFSIKDIKRKSFRICVGPFVELLRRDSLSPSLHISSQNFLWAGHHLWRPSHLPIQLHHCQSKVCIVRNNLQSWIPFLGVFPSLKPKWIVNYIARYFPPMSRPFGDLGFPRTISLNVAVLFIDTVTNLYFSSSISNGVFYIFIWKGVQKYQL